MQTLDFAPDSSGKNWICFYSDSTFYTIRETNTQYIAYSHEYGEPAQRLGGGDFQQCKKLATQHATENSKTQEAKAC